MTHVDDASLEREVQEALDAVDGWEIERMVESSERKMELLESIRMQKQEASSDGDHDTGAPSSDATGAGDN